MPSLTTILDADRSTAQPLHVAEAMAKRVDLKASIKGFINGHINFMLTAMDEMAAAWKAPMMTATTIPTIFIFSMSQLHSVLTSFVHKGN